MFGERGGRVGGKIGTRGAREERHKKLGKKKKGPLRTSPQMRRGKSRSRDRPLACAQGGRKSAENCGQRGKKGGGGKITSFRFAGQGRRRGELVTAVTLGRGNYVGVKKERWNLHSVTIKKGTEKNKVKPTHILYKIYICWRASSLAKMQFLWFFLKRNPAAKQVHLGKHCWVRCPCLSPL